MSAPVIQYSVNCLRCQYSSSDALAARVKTCSQPGIKNDHPHKFSIILNQSVIICHLPIPPPHHSHLSENTQIISLMLGCSTQGTCILT